MFSYVAPLTKHTAHVIGLRWQAPFTVSKIPFSIPPLVSKVP
jgi:hypothetical protein